MAPAASLNGAHTQLRHISLSYNSADSHSSALRLILALRPDWDKGDGHIEFVRFKDGITNTLLKAIYKRPNLSEREIDREAILLRAYGNGTEVLIDRERETISHSVLAAIGLAPALLARFENGLLYRYIEGTVCAPEDLQRQDVWRAVAARLAEWHAKLPISSISTEPSKVLQQDGPVTGERPSKVTVSDNITPGKPYPNVWTVMQKWIHALPNATAKQRARIETLQAELERATAEFQDTPGVANDGLVFAHCDLLSGNVIMEPPANSPSPSPTSSSSSFSAAPSSRRVTVSFIDYEYATPAPAAFDLANHFAEWGGFDCDFAKLPTRSQRRDFLQHYLASYNYHRDRQVEDEQFQEELDVLMRQVDAYRGLPGFYWGIWALIQAEISQIDFNYAEYAEIRLGEYWAWKGQTEGEEQRAIRERRWAEE